jgi:hypothetical protein
MPNRRVRHKQPKNAPKGLTNTKQAKAKISNSPNNLIAHILKPIVTTLVFLLASSFFPQVLQKAENENAQQCVSSVRTLNSTINAVLGSGLITAAEFENKKVQVGNRVLIISKHAAQRMVERKVTTASIQKAVSTGKLFAYAHGGIIKIGYYDEALKLFLSIDKRHQKIITAINNSSKGYMWRLINSAKAGK